MFSRSPFSTTVTSPPTPAFRTDFFSPTTMNAPAHNFNVSPKGERHPSDKSGIMPALSASLSDPSTFGLETRPAPAIVIRRLPRNIGVEALRSMLLFAGDLIDTELIRSPYPEDQGFATAVARFQTSAGALEAQQKLHGKPNTTKEANMIVEAHSGSAMGGFERRNTIDGAASRTQSSSASSAGSAVAPPPRSRFGANFQSNDKVSPPLPTSSSSGNVEFPIPENSAHFQNLFSPQSPLANGVDGHHRVSGKSMINDDSADDETGDILKDPLAYAKGGSHPHARRPTNPQVPIARFGSLTISTGNEGAINNMGSPPSSSNMTSPRSAAFPNNANAGQNSGYLPNFTRPQYPPVNPADQNPPCNTLYVGNLPIDTSEDELKHVFSKQRGYKRLCFRTKQNGPMCFVEFEDISFATKALHELYGHPLRNSVKGGIRLSFSKNPLGVRSGQTNGLNPNVVMSPQAMSPGYGGMTGGVNFSSVTGPPPGLATPPGLVNGGAYRSPPPPPNGMDGMFANPFGMPTQDFSGQLSPRQFPGNVPPTLDNGTYGRENAYTEYR